MPGAPKTRVWCERCCKKQLFAEVGILMISGLIFCVFLWPWEQLFSLLLPWRQARKLMDFRSATRSKGPRVVTLINDRLGALEALQSLIADLQPAASGPMTAEKQTTGTDDC